MENLLDIQDLHAVAGEKEILKGLNLKINKGETHVIMGPNGAGKSTTANVKEKILAIYQQIKSQKKAYSCLFNHLLKYQEYLLQIS